MIASIRSVRQGPLGEFLIFIWGRVAHLSSYQLSTINYQLSTINYQLSTINYQLSTINYQLSTINYQLIIGSLLLVDFESTIERSDALIDT